MLTLENLSLRTNKHDIFTKLNLSFLPGSIIHLTGHNGCGKTSLLRSIAGITTPCEGRILIHQTNIQTLSKPYVTYVGHLHGIEMEMTPLQNMMLWSEITGTTMLLQAAIEYFRYSDDELLQPCHALSAGNLQKLSLTRLILWPNNIWLLDEFDSNLDQDNCKLIEQLIASKAYGGGLVIFTSHHRLKTNSVTEFNLTEYSKHINQ